MSVPHFPEDNAIQAVLKALGSDDFLGERFVLKGGNALRLAFRGPRSSVDLDFTYTDRTTNQSDNDSRALLQTFCKRLNSALKIVAPNYGYERILVQSGTVHPVNRDPREFPAFEIKVGYTEREDREPPYSDVVKLEVTLNDIVCEAEYVDVEDIRVHVSSLDDIIAEKLRALLQQVHRDRNRPADVFDIWFYVTHVPRALDIERISNFVAAKSLDRLPVRRVTKKMFYDPRVKQYATVGYSEIRDRLPDSVPFPPFDEAFDGVLRLVEQLDIPEDDAVSRS